MSVIELLLTVPLPERSVQRLLDRIDRAKERGDPLPVLCQKPNIRPLVD
jgi:hypothetical protein